jgi:hypothetical protein
MSNEDAAGQDGDHTAPPQGEKPSAAGAGGVDGLRKFIFYRELAEVYLLLDNVSASTNKSLAQSPPPTDNKLETPDWIKDICKIGWPPSGSDNQLANQAATLIAARDRLNNLAAPATGATIAFTLLVSGDDKTAHEPKSADGKVGWWEVGEGWGEHVPSRFSLANIAFPNLAKPAASFRVFIPCLVGGLFIWFVITSVLSWNIATGNALLAQLKTLEVAQAAIIGQISKADGQGDGAGQPGGTKPAGAGQLQANGAPPAAAVAARPPTAANAGAAAPPACLPGSLCDQQVQNVQDLNVAKHNLQRWLDDWFVLNSLPLFGPKDACPLGGEPCTLVNEQWASVLLNVLGGAVLPICFGLLGAGAAVVRALSARIKESLLSPRHKMLFLVQLALGAVIGGCIGLFVTPSVGSAAASTSTTPSLLGSVPLSASALCFIAGFGVEGVFLALEGLVGRVFNIPDPTKPPAAGNAVNRPVT